VDLTEGNYREVDLIRGELWRGGPHKRGTIEVDLIRGEL
jgi:hypothetical protein